MKKKIQKEKWIKKRLILKCSRKKKKTTLRTDEERNQIPHEESTGRFTPLKYFLHYEVSRWKNTCSSNIQLEKKLSNTNTTTLNMRLWCGGYQKVAKGNSFSLKTPVTLMKLDWSRGNATAFGILSWRKAMILSSINLKDVVLTF